MIGACPPIILSVSVRISWSALLCLDGEDGEAERGEAEEENLSAPAADTDEAGGESDHSDVVSAGQPAGDFPL